MLEEIFDQVGKKMESSLEAFQKELATIRTGRASISLLDGIMVEYYGTPTPLNQVATLSVPESRLITIQPWDQTIIKDIERAILKSDLGFTPTNDGRMVRIAVPPLTEERRQHLAKMVKKLAEECKVAIRNVRREGNEQIKSAEKEKKISEDDSYKALDRMQKITDEFVSKADETCRRKEKEVMEVS